MIWRGAYRGMLVAWASTASRGASASPNWRESFPRSAISEYTQGDVARWALIRASALKTRRITCSVWLSPASVSSMVTSNSAKSDCKAASPADTSSAQPLSLRDESSEPAPSCPRMCAMQRMGLLVYCARSEGSGQIIFSLLCSLTGTTLNHCCSLSSGGAGPLKEVRQALVCGEPGRVLVLLGGRALVGHALEEGQHQLLEQVERLAPQHCEAHPVGRVVRRVEIDQRAAHVDRRVAVGARLIAQCGPRATVEARPRVPRVRRRLEQLPQPPKIALQVVCILRIYGVHLALRGTLRETRGQEKLREPIERSRQKVVVDIKEEGGVLVRGER
eukprot:795963-Prymnesium_polylepis.1